MKRVNLFGWFALVVVSLIGISRFSPEVTEAVPTRILMPAVIVLALLFGFFGIKKKTA